jgi:hypothetical protein
MEQPIWLPCGHETKTGDYYTAKRMTSPDLKTSGSADALAMASLAMKKS